MNDIFNTHYMYLWDSKKSQKSGVIDEFGDWNIDYDVKGENK